MLLPSDGDGWPGPLSRNGARTFFILFDSQNLSKICTYIEVATRVFRGTRHYVLITACAKASRIWTRHARFSVDCLNIACINGTLSSRKLLLIRRDNNLDR